MATADQVKALVKAHFEHEDEKFKTIVLQIAAYEATHGHETYARELKKYAEKIDSPKSNVFRINQQNPIQAFGLKLCGHCLCIPHAGRTRCFSAFVQTN